MSHKAHSGQGYQYTGSTGPMSYNYVEKVALELDFVINDFRNPTEDITVDKLLGYMYHYYPYVKAEYNLRLLLANFLNSSTCFGGEAPFASTFRIIEVFRLITERKLKVSQPTLPLKIWYDVLRTELEHFIAYDPAKNCWKVLPIVCGVLMSNALRDELYTNEDPISYRLFFHRFDSQMNTLFKKCLYETLTKKRSSDIVNLSIICLALLHKKDQDMNTCCTNIPHEFIIDRIFDILLMESNGLPYVISEAFTEKNGIDSGAKFKEALQAPTIRILNKLSFLLESCMKELPPSEVSCNVIERNLNKLHHFNHVLNRRVQDSAYNSSVNLKGSEEYDQFWVVLKSILFAEVVIFQGMLTVFLFSGTRLGLSLIFHPAFKRRFDLRFQAISLKILHSLYFLNFILLSIGSGGFDNYNFVYYLSIELALKNSVSTEQFEALTKYLIGNYEEVNLHPTSVINQNYVVRSKVLFVIGLWENYLQQPLQNISFVRDYVFRICMSLIDDSKYNDKDLIEASHSVLLTCLSKFNGDIDKEVSEYMKYLIRQFPGLISATQLNIGIEVIGKKILSKSTKLNENYYETSSDKFLNHLFFLCSNTKCGVLITNYPNNDTFNSAQPISEIDAASTMSLLDPHHSKTVDIIKNNKVKKPKDTFPINLHKDSNKSESDSPNERKEPSTIREALIMAVIQLVPYLPIGKFEYWLDKIWILIECSNVSESTFLYTIFWKVLSENLDLNRADIAYNWWYEVKKAAENPPSKNVLRL